jgi:hypothetical protein
MVVAGPTSVTNSGVAASYDPSTDQWTEWCGFKDYQRSAHAWDGDGVFLWSGVDIGNVLVADGLHASSSCQVDAIPSDGAPTPRADASAVWTGTALIVYGGRIAFPKGWFATDDGASYDPATGQWSPLIPGGTPGARAAHQAFWTGSEMIVWGGGGTPAGCVYKP